MDLQNNALYIPNSVWPTTIGAVTRDGLTPLGLAVRMGYLDTIKYLIMERNMDVNGKLVTHMYVKYSTSQQVIIKNLLLKCLCSVLYQRRYDTRASINAIIASDKDRL